MKESENEKSIIINIYRPGSQHVDRVENQYIGYPAPGPAPERGGENKGSNPLNPIIGGNAPGVCIVPDVFYYKKCGR